MDPELKTKMLKYYEKQFGKILPKNVSIEEFLNSVIDTKRVDNQLKILKHYVKLSKKDVILDFGSGFGDFVINSRKSGYKSYGYEIEKELFELCVQRQEGSYKKYFLHTTNGTVPIEVNLFSLVYSNFVLEHVNDLDLYVSEALRVLKKNGRIFIMTCNYKLSYEFHYGLFLPLFSLKLSRLVLKILGRDTDYINTLNFVTPEKIYKAMQNISKNYNFHYIDQSAEFFYSELFNKEYHSHLFILLAKTAKLFGLTKILVKLRFYNPIIITIVKD